MMVPSDVVCNESEIWNQRVGIATSSGPDDVYYTT